MKTKKVSPTAEHLKFRAGLIAVLEQHKHLQVDEMLAVTAYFLGQLLALQDQKLFTPAQALELISQNIEAGNADAIADFFKDVKIV